MPQHLTQAGLTPIPEADTAGSARIVSETKDTTLAAIASSLAAEIYGLKILKNDIEDEKHNTPRFVILSPTQADAKTGTGQPSPLSSSACETFRLRSIKRWVASRQTA